MQRKYLGLAALALICLLMNLSAANAQVPVSGFTVAPLSPYVKDTFCAGVSVNFTDTSTNSPTTWSWNFNSTSNVNVTASPSNSSTQSPIVIFSNSTIAMQAVVITLNASNVSGGSLNTATKTIYIAPGQPTAIISASPTTICKDSSISFSSASSNGLITNYSWNFGSGTPSLSTSSGVVKDTFTIASTVTLAVSNACGSNTATYHVNLTPPPVASFTPSTSNPCNNVPVTFSDNSIYAPTSWSWNFGHNGHVSNLQNPVDSFSTPGTYTVTLIASNYCGPSAPWSTTITVQNCSPPTAYFKTASDTVCMNQPVLFIDSSWNTSSSIRSWRFFPASSPYDTSTAVNPTTQFNTAGPATVTLTIQSANGPSTYTKHLVVLRCLPPTALFDSWGSICQGTCTYVTNNSTEAPFTSKWYFYGADSATSTKFNPSNICYQNAGLDSIKLVVTNQYGSSSLTKPIVILPAPKILSHDTCIYAGYSVQLYAHGHGLITWSPTTGLSPTTGDTVLASPLNQVTYSVRDTTSCPSVDTVVVCVKYKNVYIMASNTFTPDGNTKNDVFKVSSKDGLPINEFSMKIFNRWGEMVFKTSDYLEGWDGTYRGVQQNSGVYVYIIGYRDLGDNQYKFINGNVTLIR